MTQLNSNMSKYKWSNRSQGNIDTTNQMVRVFCAYLIRRATQDVCVLGSGGRRTAAMQRSIYDKGHSKCDGVVQKSYHQSGWAVDLVAYVDGRPNWASKGAYLSLARTAQEVWRLMQANGEDIDPHTGRRMHMHQGIYWGSKDLNNDRILDSNDKLGWDLAHVEWRHEPQTKHLKLML